MFRRAQFAPWFVCAASLAAVALPASRGLDRDSEANATLDKAWDLVDIRAAGGAPFVVKATVRLTEGEKSSEGVYAMSWAAPDRFRRVVGFQDYAETDVARGENYYSKRNTYGVPLMIWNLSELMDSLEAHKRKPGGAKVNRVENQSIGGKETRCFLVGADEGDSRICVEATTHEVISIEEGVGKSATFREKFEYSDYQAFGTKTFPRRFMFSGWGERSIEVTIEKLVTVRDFAADEFSPRAASQISRYCTGTEEMTGEVTSVFNKKIPTRFMHRDAVIYLEISPKGIAQSAQIVYRPMGLRDKDVLSWFLGAHFPVKTCDGRPIGYQMMYRPGQPE